MKILAIETSCDETCLAIALGEGKSLFDLKILSSIVSSQIEIHKPWGGVYPSLAKREHEKNLVPVFKEALKKAGLLRVSEKLQKSKIEKIKEILKREKVLCQNLIDFLKKYKKPKIDLIAVTIGPGLEPCLFTGINFAKSLAFFWGLPVVPVNHIEAHIFANFLNDNLSMINNKDLFPSVCLVVSGGHTQLILMKDFGKYKILGETRDDAAGEAFDKIARILGLPYPGGPAIEKIASQKPHAACNLQFAIKLPRPMIHSKDYDFSFSGLKTAVLYDFKKRPKKIRESKEYIRRMAYEVQRAIIDVLTKKTIKAAKEYKAKAIIIGGGVAANQKLREELKSQASKLETKPLFFAPKKELSTDNAQMVAICGYFYWLKSDKIKNWRLLRAWPHLKIT
jgi:N6-L-threonylcarbamoyladenine synthase